MISIPKGSCTKYNAYLLVSFICELLAHFLFGLNDANKLKPLRFFPFEPKLKSHFLFDNFIRIAVIFFAGIFLYLIEKKIIKKNDDELTIEEIGIIKENIFKEKNEKIKTNLAIIGIVFSLYIIIDNFIALTDGYVGLWGFEIMYVCIISRAIFNIKIYKHKKLAIYIMLVISIIEFIFFFFPMTKHENDDDINELTDKNVFEKIIIKFGTYAIPILFIANELKHIQRDYCWIKSKYLIDIKSISPYKIFLSIGIIGFIFIIIFFSIFSFVPCKSFNNVIKINNEFIDMNTNKPLELYKEYCSLKDYDENTYTLYLMYDSIKLISNEYSNTNIENMIEIFIIIPLYFLILFVNEISKMMMVRYTDPNNILIYRNIFYFMKRLINEIVNQGDEKYITYLQFSFLQFGEIVSIISNMIYIEIIELKFCNFDFNLKKNIALRGRNDSMIIENENNNTNEHAYPMINNDNKSELSDDD